MTGMMDKAKQLWTEVASFLTPTTDAWLVARRVMWAFIVFVPLSGLFLSVMPDFSVQKLIGFAVFWAYLGVMAALIIIGLWLLDKMPKLARILLILTAVFAFRNLIFMWNGPVSGMIIVAGFLLGLMFLIGGVRAIVRYGFDYAGYKRATFFTLLGAGMAGFICFQLLKDQGSPNPELDDYTLGQYSTVVAPDTLSNPAEKGPYAVETFTYGRGNDKWRPEYADGVRYQSETSDGRALVPDWKGVLGWARSGYWGFDASEFPRNGRVWMPSGPNAKGPFPLVLMVHGNHGMEDYSDPGYAYIGEHFASRGMIFVSVDENFLNSSMADRINPFRRRGIAPENDARGWMLLEHLAQWRTWMMDPEHPLYGMADMDRVGLMGHSRGGEAVVTAATFNQLSHYPDDANLAFHYGFNLRGIIAVAPVDQQYKPRQQPTPLRDVNFFTIHGSQDGDVISFSGTAPYSRLKFTEDQFRFKSSLYINGANHGQFNTTWGRHDFGGLSKHFLDVDHIMDPEAQRQIGKVYFTAFMESVMWDRDDYLPLFQDARFGARWLPDVFMINNYQDSQMALLATYEEDIDPGTSAVAGAKFVGKNLTQWREEDIKLKYRPQGNNMVRLAWDKRVHPDVATYALVGDFDLSAHKSLTFSVSDAGGNTLPLGFDADDLPKASKTNKPAEKGVDKTLDWRIELEDAHGQMASVKLSDNHPLYPQIKAATVKWAAMDEAPTSEMVARFYHFDLAAFKAQNPDLDLKTIWQVRLVFDQTPKGAIYLDDMALQ